jgi:hypothetical protein
MAWIFVKQRDNFTFTFTILSCLRSSCDQSIPFDILATLMLNQHQNRSLQDTDHAH